MAYVRPKKHLGQHFLKDENIARKIVDSLKSTDSYSTLVEVGAGTGVLTKYLFENPDFKTVVIEIDTESVEYLQTHFPEKKEQVLHADFLKFPFKEQFTEPFGIIGNFPYNISSQIFFRVLENRELVIEVVGMIQKEVADRIASGPGNKTYGILSVLLQAYYDIEYLFKVPPQVFNPPPKVDSAVIRLKRNPTAHLSCDEKRFFEVVKAGFNQRRKTLRNALKSFLTEETKGMKILDKRAEQLSVADFESLTNSLFP